MVVAGAWGEAEVEERELMCNGNRVSLLQEEKSDRQTVGMVAE